MLPEGWSCVNLNDISTKIMVGIASAATHAYSDSGIRMLRNLNIKEGWIDDSDVLHINQEYEQQHKNKRLREGDILTVRTGYPGLSAVVPKLYENAQCFTSLVTRLDQEKALPNYVCRFINSEYGKKFIASGEAGGAQKNVNAAMLKKMPVPLPPLAEQHKIAQILEVWDKSILVTETLIETSKQQKKALMQQLLTAKKRFAGFNEEWQTKSLYKCLLGSSLRNKDLAMSHEDLRSVTKANGMVPMKDRVKGESVERCKIVRNNWFAYNPMRLNVGSICRWKEAENCLVSPDYVVFSCNEDLLLTEYFDHFRSSHSWNDFMVRAGNGSVRVRIYLNDLAPLKITLPPLEEQKKIASVLTAASKEIKVLETKLAHLKQEKKALMQQLLTGKRRVKVDAEEAA